MRRWIRPDILYGCVVLAMASWLAALYTSAQPAAPRPLPLAVASNVRWASEYVDARVLAPDVAEAVTVPDFVGGTAPVIAVYSATCANWYLVPGVGPAAVPVTDVTDGTAAERNPAALRWLEGAVYSVVSPSACIITIAYSPERAL